MSKRTTEQTREERLRILEQMCMATFERLHRQKLAFADAGDRIAELHARPFPQHPAAAKPKSPEPVLFGDQKHEAMRLGGTDRFVKLREIAEASGLDLDRPNERAIAEARLWDAVGSTISAAKCWDEAIHLAEREVLKFTEADRPKSRTELLRYVTDRNPSLMGERPRGYVQLEDDMPDSPEAIRMLLDLEARKFCETHRLDPWEPRERAQAVRAVAARSPQLTRALFYADRASTPTTPAQVRAVAFSAAVDDVLRDQDCPNTPAARRRAAEHVRKTRPDLIDGAGSRGRK